MGHRPHASFRRSCNFVFVPKPFSETFLMASSFFNMGIVNLINSASEIGMYTGVVSVVVALSSTATVSSGASGSNVGIGSSLASFISSGSVPLGGPSHPSVSYQLSNASSIAIRLG